MIFEPGGTAYPFGNLPPQRCQLCGETRTRFGVLLDPNGHVWRICASDEEGNIGCINTLWRDNQKANREAEIEARAQAMVQDMVARLLNREGDVQ